MVSYILQEIKDEYFLTNTEITQLQYSLEKLDDCTDYVPIALGILTPDEELQLQFTGDADYRLVLTNTNLDTVTIPIKLYTDLEISTINSVYDALCACDCGCSDCTDSDKTECSLLLQSRSRLDAYVKLVSPKYSNFFTKVAEVIKCYVTESYNCVVEEEKIQGESLVSNKVVKQLLGIDYLTIFFAELYSNTGEEDYTREKYKSNSILCCISKLGVDIKEIEEIIADNISTLTIVSQAGDNQAPTTGDNEITVPNRSVTILTFEMFTTQTTPPYSDPEGDLADAVRINTVPTVGQLKFNSLPVYPGQIFLKVEVDSGNLVYYSPNINNTASVDISFSVRDSGSQTWSS